jgi:hypothetical protein
MQIPSANLLLPLSSGTSREPLLQQLTPGQILQGTALSENIGGRLSLQIGVARLIAQTQLSVRPGQQLTLQVVKTDSLPELRVLTLPSLLELKAAAMKSLLPRQQPLPQLFKALAQVISATPREPLPSNVRQQAETTLSQTLSTNNPTFKAEIKQALANSGLLTEARLLQRVSNPADIKLNLVRLYQAIRQLVPEEQLPKLPMEARTLTSAPAERNTATQQPLTDTTIRALIDLLKQVDGGIARIQTHQLSSLPQDDASRQVWQFELPIRNGQEMDLFHFRISQESRSQQAQEETQWSLTLHMNLSELGAMRVQLRLQGETISTVIWSEKNETNDLVRNHLDRLRSSYVRSGLEVKQLDAFLGTIDKQDEFPIELPLLHEKA